jgi:hypothetical protein
MEGRHSVLSANQQWRQLSELSDTYFVSHGLRRAQALSRTNDPTFAMTQLPELQAGQGDARG